jgi:hypothetical protein
LFSSSLCFLLPFLSVLPRQQRCRPLSRKGVAPGGSSGLAAGFSFFFLSCPRLAPGPVECPRSHSDRGCGCRSRGKNKVSFWLQPKVSNLWRAVRFWQVPKGRWAVAFLVAARREWLQTRPSGSDAISVGDVDAILLCTCCRLVVSPGRSLLQHHRLATLPSRRLRGHGEM